MTYLKLKKHNGSLKKLKGLIWNLTNLKNYPAIFVKLKGLKEVHSVLTIVVVYRTLRILSVAVVCIVGVLW